MLSRYLPSFRGCWMIILYFALLGLIWLPRYFIIPSQLRLWPSFLLYNALSQPSSSNQMLVNTSSFATANKKLFSDIFYKTPRKHQIKPPLLNVELGDTKQCFTCPLTRTVKQCGTSFYALMLFGLSNYPLSKDFGIFSHEPYPCYSKSSKAGSCIMNIEGVNTAPDVLPGAACSVCNSCSKSFINHNMTLSSVPRKHFYMPKFTFQISNRRSKRGRKEKIFVHCVNSLIYIKFGSIDQFCEDIDGQLSAYSYVDQDTRITVVSTCKDFCTESQNVITRELYSSEIGVYLIIVAMICSVIVCVLYTIDYILSLWRELGVLNISWNDVNAICPICMDTLYRFVRVATLPCGHSFCRTCLHQWLHTFYHITCPLCRQPVDPGTPTTTTASLVQPPMLMLTDNTSTGEDNDDDEDEHLDEENSDTSHSLFSSIYNYGSNIVSRWSNPSPSTSGSPQTSVNGSVIYTHPPTTTVFPIPLPHYSLSTVAPLRNGGITQVYSSPIVLPYNTSQSTLDSSPSFLITVPPIVPYNTSQSTLSSSSSHFITFSQVLPYNTSQSILASSSTHSYSDSEVLNVVPLAVQNRIARKLNRTRQKRQIRRSLSTSDMTTSATSATSESESDYSSHY